MCLYLCRAHAARTTPRPIREPQDALLSLLLVTQGLQLLPSLVLRDLLTAFLLD